MCVRLALFVRRFCVAVPVMNVGEVWMRMRQRLVNMGMRVRLGRVNARRVRVWVMLIVGVAMRMLQPLVMMLVFVPLGEMQPNADPHQHSGEPEGTRHRFT